MAANRSTTVRYLSVGLRIVTILFLALSAFGPAYVTPVFADQLVCGIPGKDGPASTLSGVVNTYYPGTANVTAGSTSIPVGSLAGAATPIQAGDLLLVIQMQGADINSTNTGAYGDGAAGDPAAGNLGGTTFSAGRYEYVVATSGVAGGNVSISAGLANDYFNQDYPVGATNQGQRRYQVIRVPQYSNATMTGTVTALAWNGSVGGVVVLDVAGTLNFGGNTIDVSGRGFRGGGGVRYRGGTGVSTDYRTLSTNTANASKGEGTAGTPRFIYTGATVIDQGVNLEGYPNGSFARGAPGNAGGGGTDGNPPDNDQNTGGGGGGNGGAGGHGGTAWDNAPADSGGFGGALFPASTSRLVLGGGGGAGTIDDNDPEDSSGAAGGGIAFVIAGTITGNGSINANGLSAPGQILNDSGGGGGAGGSVVVVAHTAALPAGLNITANGGRGGNAWPGEPPGPDYPGTRHGPGGGGGGGVIFHSNGAVTLSVAGGQNGITTTANDNYLATPGALGIMRNLGGDPPSFPNCVPVPSVVKTTSTSLVNQTPTGTSGVYKIVASVPAGQGTALGFTISDVLPDGFTYASTTSVNLSGGAARPVISNPTAGSPNPAWGTFNIPGGGAVTITFTVNIAPTVPAGTYQNPATATFLDPTRTETGGTATTEYDITDPGEDITVQLASLPDLTVTKTNNVNGTVVQGSPFNWTITVANSGGAPATFASGQVVMSDALPGAASYYPQGNLTVNPPGAIICTIDNTALACTANGIYSLAAGASFSVTFQVTPTAAGNLVNTAVADPGGIMPESNENNNTASNTVQVTPANADLAIDKTNGQTSYLPGSVVTYTVTVTNLSGITANGATVSDSKPANVTTWAWACTTQSGGATGCDPAANGASNFTDTVNLPVGGSIVYTVTANVSANATGNLVNTAEVTTPTGLTDPDETNNTSTDTDLPPGTADLSIDKTNGQTSYLPGSVVTYTVTVKNLSGATANGAIVTDNKPANVTTWAWACTTQSGGATGCDPAADSANNFTDTVNLPVGGSIVYTVTANTLASATTNLTNTANVDVPPGLTDPNEGNNTSTDDDPPAPPDIVDLSVTKDNGQTAFIAGQTVTYTVTVKNNSGVTATGAVVSDPKPSNIATWVWDCTAQSGGATACDGMASSTNNFTDTVNLPVNGTIVYTVTAKVVATPASPILENTVTVDPPSGFTDSDPANNSATDRDELGPSADLSLTKTASATKVNAGDTITFTLTLKNDGPDTAYGVEVTDKLPSGFKYVSSIASKGTYDSVTGIWAVGEMPAKATETLTITVTVNSSGDHTNVAEITQSLADPAGIAPLPDPDSTPGNGSSGSAGDEDDLGESKISLKEDPSPKPKPNPFLIPVTGFQPGVVTDLSRVPHETYLATADVTLEIPSLGVKIPIVGVPKKDGTWNVTWLENQAGWLEGSAFPSWTGNSVLTSHVYLASGKPGPFVNLNKLKFGDKILVHAYGQKYTFEVQINTVVAPTDKSMMKHEEKPWLTLVTCKDYDPKTNTYLNRILVRARLVSVDWE